MNDIAADIKVTLKAFDRCEVGQKGGSVDELAAHCQGLLRRSLEEIERLRHNLCGNE
jgi:hypothetical protein